MKLPVTSQPQAVPSPVPANTDNGATAPQSSGGPSSSLSDWVLGGLFALLVIASLIALSYDFRALMAATPGFETGQPGNGPNRMDLAPPLPTPGGTPDQLRRYNPASAPIRGAGTPLVLPGFTGDPEAATTGRMIFFADEVDAGAATAIGRIAVGSYAAFEQFLDANPDVSTITFQSPGGSVRDAFAMALLIREREINTSVAQNGYCASSCPLAFSGGVERISGGSVAFGVHQVFTSQSQVGTVQDGMAGAQHISSQAQTLLSDMGVDPAAWIHAMATPKEQLYLFTDDELNSYRWVTNGQS